MYQVKLLFDILHRNLTYKDINFIDKKLRKEINEYFPDIRYNYIGTLQKCRYFYTVSMPSMLPNNIAILVVSDVKELITLLSIKYKTI